MNKWNLNKIKKGFEKFLEENNRLPTTPEIDKVSYLPSSRTMQRSFGGVENVRKKLGYSDVHFGKGKHRSKIARKAHLDGLNAEQIAENLLIKKFGEPFVHIEKRIGSKKNRLDFFIYSPTDNFGIDIFCPNSFKDLQKNVNAKITKFVNIGCLMIYLVSSKKFQQNKINDWISNKRKPMPINSVVMTMKTFEKFISNFDVYKDPTKK